MVLAAAGAIPDFPNAQELRKVYGAGLAREPFLLDTYSQRLDWV